MRCEKCGRSMKNSEMWQLTSDPSAPASRSMRHLCWDCREETDTAEEDASTPTAVEEAAEVARRHGANDL